MKRSWKIVIIIFSVIFLLLSAALIAGYIFLKNFDIARYKPQIIEMAGRSLGRPVDFKDIRLKVSLWDGVRLKLSDLSIAENPDFGEGAFFGVKEVDAGVNVLAFLKSGQVSVPNVLISSPRVNIIRNAAGVLNAQTIIPAKSPAPSAPVSAGLPAIFVGSFKVENAEINFIDKSTQPAQEVSINKVNLSARNFSLIHHFDISLDAAMLSSQANLHASGKMLVNIIGNEVKFKDVEVGLDLNSFSLDDLRRLPFLAGQPLPSELGGMLKLKVKEGAVSAKGVTSLLVDLSFSGGRVIFPDIAPGISLEAGKLDFALEGFSLNPAMPFNLKATAALYQEQPNVNFSAKGYFDPKSLELRLSNGQFSTDLALWPLDKMKSALAPLKSAPLPSGLSGKLTLDIKDLRLSPAGLKTMLVGARLNSGEAVLDNITPGVSLSLRKIDLALIDLSQNLSCGVTASLGYESDTPNIFFNGKLAFNPAGPAFNLSQAEIKSDLSRIPLEVMKEKISALQDVALPDTLAGEVSAQIKQLSASDKGVSSIQADVYLKNGAISMKDAAPGISLSATRVNAQVKNIGLDSLIDFNIGLAGFSDEENISAKGKIYFHVPEQSLSLKDAAITLDLAAINLERLQSSVAALKSLSLPQSLKGKINLAVSQAVAGAGGLASLSGRGMLSGWEVKLKELAIPISGSDMVFNLTEKDFTPGTINAVIGKGQIQANVAVTDYLTNQNFSLSAEIKGIDVSEILSQEQSPVKIAGLVYGNIKARGAGANLNSISGDGAFEVKDARLKDFNVLKVILDKISFIPGLSDRLDAKLPEKYKAKLSDKDTVINKVSAPCLISQGSINLEPITVESDEFIFSGKCQAGFDQKYVLDGALKIPAELSSAMAAGASELQYLFDENNNISLPVHASGQGAQPPAISVTQTALDIGKNAFRNQAKKELGRILGKVLGVEEKSGSSETQPQEQAGEQSGGQQGIESAAGQILDMIFKNK